MFFFVRRSTTCVFVCENVANDAYAQNANVANDAYAQNANVGTVLYVAYAANVATAARGFPE